MKHKLPCTHAEEHHSYTTRRQACAGQGRMASLSHRITGENFHSEENTEQQGIASFNTNIKRFSWTITGMDCPSCAKKIENAVIKLAGIQRVRVLFSSGKLLIDAVDDPQNAVIAAVNMLGFTLLHDGEKKPKQPSGIDWLNERYRVWVMGILIALSWCAHLFQPQIGAMLFWFTAGIGIVPIMNRGIRFVFSGSPFAIEVLMSLAVLGALFLGATSEAATVIFLFMIGEKLESYAANRARQGVKSLMALVPEQATVLRGVQRFSVAAKTLCPGDIIEVSAGSRVPADVTLISSSVSIDQSALTGESIPVVRYSGDKIAAGCLVMDSVVQMEVTSQPGKNAIDRILTLIEEAEEKRAPIERFLDRFSRYYTPCILLLALCTWLIPPLLLHASWDVWLYRSLTLLLIGCPCALVISTPAAITSGLAAATRHGILIKGGAALEQLATIQQMALDKTGTLTVGKPVVTDVLPSAGVTVRQLLAWSAAVEIGSHHPLAQAIVHHTQSQTVEFLAAQQRKILPGEGIQGEVQGKTILLSAPQRHLAKGLFESDQQQITRLQDEGKTVVIVQQDGVFAGLLALQDRLREEAVDTLAHLRTLGISAVMLTGDNHRAAKGLAHQLNIDFKAQLLPEDKVKAINDMSEQNVVAMVGDGINDAPAMKTATVGIAMGTGADVALETADVALTQDNLFGLVKMVKIARDTRANIWQNITVALGLKGLLLITSIVGVTGLWLAVLADSGATALVTLNAIRLLKKHKI